MLAENTHDKPNKNQNLEREEAKKAQNCPQMSQKSQK